MGETAAALMAAAIVVPPAIFLVYLGVRNLIASLRNVRQTVSQASSPAPNAPKQKSVGLDNLVAQMTNDLQEKAKQSDEAHKARIRAHANRPVPSISDEGRETITRGLQARLGIKHRYPPRLPQRSMSYLGGLPIVPDDFDWPTLHNRKGLLERLNFMAQIDCSDLPPGPGAHRSRARPRRAPPEARRGIPPARDRR